MRNSRCGHVPTRPLGVDGGLLLGRPRGGVESSLDAVVSRRRVLAAGLVAGAVAVVGLPPGVATAAPAGPEPEAGFLSAGQMRVLIAAVSRIVPSDATQLGGAVEWGAFNYVQRLLTAGVDGLYAGGPVRCDFDRYIAAWPAKRRGWAGRIDGWRAAYVGGLRAIDATARARYGTGFAASGAAQQDEILAEQDGQDTAFFRALYSHTMEGCYAHPVYGGNHGYRGWQAWGYRGDTHGVTDADPVRDVFPQGGATTQLGLRYTGRFGSNPFGAAGAVYSGTVYVPDGWEAYAACGLPTGGYAVAGMTGVVGEPVAPVTSAACATACGGGTGSRSAAASLIPASRGSGWGAAVVGLPNTGWGGAASPVGILGAGIAAAWWVARRRREGRGAGATDADSAGADSAGADGTGADGDGAEGDGAGGSGEAP